MQYIESKEDYRLELMRAIEASYSRFSRAVDRHINNSAKPINAEDLDAFPLRKWIALGTGISAMRRKNRFKSYLSFDIKMKKGSEFAEHFHDDIIESTEVLEGEMVDTPSGVVYKIGDVAHWEVGIKHTPVATKTTILHVLFKKGNNEE